MSSGRIIIITAPSGSGKTTLVKSLLKRLPQLSFSVSACTRQPRGNEKEGIDYYFLSVPDFENKILREEFLEWEMVYPGKYYGTLKSEIERIWQNKQFPLVDIDVQGALRVKKQFVGQSLSIFIQAPSIEELKRRLQKRGTEAEEAIKERVEKAKSESALSAQFDYILVNDQLDKAKEALFQIASKFMDHKD